MNKCIGYYLFYWLVDGDDGDNGDDFVLLDSFVFVYVFI